MSITSFFIQNPIVFHAVIILASLLVIIKAATYLIRGITNYSEKLGLSDYITGMIIVAIAASVPELVSSIMGIVSAEPGIVFGTIIGSNISGIALVLAVFAMVGKKINLKSRIFKKTEMMIFIFSIIPFLLVADGRLSRTDGIMLIILYFTFVIVLWKREGQLGGIKKQIKIKSIYKDALLFILALAAMLLSARWLVFSAIEASEIVGISPYYISLVIIGIGATIPDITVGVSALLKGHQNVGIGNALGSMLTKSLLFLGIISIIQPLVINFNVLLIAVVFAITTTGVAFYFIEKGSMTWKNGVLMLLLYIAFIAIQSLKGG